ncbi:MAG: hypothetical protein K2F89_09690, partial [Treponemataceae bacterium]|nr:hypothetical protein [Treponemataceae bacterium]
MACAANQRFAITARIFAALRQKAQKLAAVSTFKRTFIAFLERFRHSKVLLLLPQRSFGVQKHFCAFLDAISTFKRTFVACPSLFRGSKELCVVYRRVF